MAYSDLKDSFGRHVDNLSYISLLFLIIFGLFANTVTLIIFYRRWRENVMTAQYVVTLAVVDSIYLIGPYFSNYILRNGFRHWFGDSIYIWQGLWPQRIYQVINSGSMISSWVLVLFNIERTLAMTLPLTAPKWFTPKKRLLGICLLYTSPSPRD